MLPATTEDPERSARVRRQYGVLRDGELWWKDRQLWLQERGYMLRPRYRPGWKPSWDGRPDIDPFYCEDSVTLWRDTLMDAIRIADGKIVMLKKVVDAINPTELEINRLFSTEPLVSHPRNHCVPVREVLEIPGEEGVHIMVMPLLGKFNEPTFSTVGEVVGCFHQVFEGLQFMHQCHVAHRDCMDLNIMMDPNPIFPKLFHPQTPLMDRAVNHTAKHYTRTWRPTKYFLIDFGLSGVYDPAKGHTTDLPVLSGDRTVPEFENNMDRPHEVYPTDIYYIGNMIRESFLQKFDGVEFMDTLVADMVQADPKMRPTIDEVVRRFAEIRQSLSWRKLRSRLVDKNQRMSTMDKVFTETRHFLRIVGCIVTFRSAVPLP